RRVYDGWGNVILSPQAPASGAGIATLNPIAEVPPGDVDLIAPLGTSCPPPTHPNPVIPATRRVYDGWGNVILSPQAPASGAGIATLNPIAEV
ncbi:hypothetical protein C7E12_20350, partial [Stenotrophomonas maltophilia]